MSLAEILERNRAYVQGRDVRPLPPPGPVRLVVLACYDPRLDPVLRPALGIDEGQAFVIRSAGAVVRPAGDPLRSIALATYLFDVTDVMVVGHTTCRMAAFETARFIEAFRARGVARASFGDVDLRVWAGAIHDPAAGVRASVAALRSAPCLPRDLAISGLVLDDTSGALTVVVHPDEAVTGGPSSLDAPLPGPAPVAPSPGPTEETDVPVPVPRAQAAEGAGQRLIDAVRAMVETVASHAHWSREFQQLRAELATHTNPLRRVRLIETFVRQAAADSREVAAALERVKREASALGRRLDDRALIELLRRAFMGDSS